jgi:hypothetical protein
MKGWGQLRPWERFMNKILLFTLILSSSCLVSSAETNMAIGVVSSSTTSSAIESHSFSPSTEAALKAPAKPRVGPGTSEYSRFDLTGRGSAKVDPAVTAAMRRLEVQVVGGKKAGYLDTVRERIASGYYDEARDRAAFPASDPSFSGTQMNIFKTFLQ